MQDITFLAHSLGLRLPSSDPLDNLDIMAMAVQSSMAPRLRDNEFAYYLSLDPQVLQALHSGQGDPFEWKLRFLMHLQSLDQGTWTQVYLDHISALCRSLNLPPV